MITMWQLSDAIQTKNRIIYVEVCNKHENILRQDSKMNLDTIVDTFLKKRKFGLFDKFWYLKRAENFDNMVYRGVHVEDEKVVELDFKHFFKGKD